jgi:hypothetical protein
LLRSGNIADSGRRPRSRAVVAVIAIALLRSLPAGAQDVQEPWPREEYALEGDCLPAPGEPDPGTLPKPGWFGLHHSSTNGRNVGWGTPLTGTSWLNRPYYVGGELGTMWLTQPVNNHISTDTDFFGGIFTGCDFDHYWGTELSVHRATPELINENSPGTSRGDRLMIWSASLMYYPWGDSLYRPYWRWGLGATEIDYPTDDGLRRDEDLWTFPIGIGLKYPIQRWLAARTELTDQLALGNSGVATQHNITLTFGLEWRFGFHRRSYWPWNPSRQIW